MSNSPLKDFVRESNRIEGIHREPTGAEIDAHMRLLAVPVLSVDEVEWFVRVVADADLRREPGMDVRVGSHYPPRGGPYVERRLEELLSGQFITPYEWHRRYEELHPFMDGNGRSGRAIWLRMMGGVERVPLGFLHTWYYQSLSSGRDTPPSPKRMTMGDIFVEVQ